MNIILQTNDLSKNYGRVQAVDCLNLKVEESSVYGILGPNGSGKTTTLSIISGAIYSSSGTFTWFNYNTNELNNVNIGTLLEQPNFYPYLSVKKNLEIACLIKDISESETEIKRVLEIVKLQNWANAKFKQLSFGMKQRVALASLLLGDPKVLVLDEPTNGLDPEGIAHIREIIKNEAKKGKTIILASHILDEVEKVCSHVAILKRGKVIAQGKVNDLIKSDDEIHVACNDNDALFNKLQNSNMCKSVNFTGEKIIVILNQGYEPSLLNKYAFDNGFVLSQFEIHKKSLEDLFLEVTK